MFQIQIVFPTVVTGNMEEYVTDADQFLPERWLKNSVSDIQYKFHPFASLPYGHGARMCLGRRFADLEMQVLLAKVGGQQRLMQIEVQSETIFVHASFCFS